MSTWIMCNLDHQLASSLKNLDKNEKEMTVLQKDIQDHREHIDDLKKTRKKG